MMDSPVMKWLKLQNWIWQYKTDECSQEGNLGLGIEWVKKW